MRVPERVDGTSPIRVEVELRNVSERSGSEVVQLYLSHRGPRLPRPDQELAAFAKTTLAPGEATTLTLEIAPRALAYWDPAEHAFVLEPGTFEVRAGRSSTDLRRSARFDLTRQGRLE